MGLSNKLCNPTPFKQVFHYGAGTMITVDAFGSYELHYNQMEDFVPTKPGWPAIKEDLEFKGLFVLDPDRPYDNQAYTAIKRSRELKEERYRSGREEMKNAISRQGLQFSEENLNERLARAGYIKLLNEITELTQQEQFFAKTIKAEEVKTKKQFVLDPKRTVFVLDPPREFPSVSAMNYFLERPENAAVKVAHEKFWNKEENTSSTKKDKVNENKQPQ